MSRMDHMIRTKPRQVAKTSRQARKTDIFYQLGIDPLSMATNASVLSEYVTEMGLIKPRLITNLTVKSQRKIGKAIRRARMMGVLPIFHKLWA
ncbi:ribosomal protein S18 [Coprinopsis marcescibilis]|uniref:Small ribosomal subunit protein bS18m n=1 Tax=Coprinopsis marcescibilis TaxID=230819 RepID=A0A5C3L8N0_COPMA|nr:ribosomal protein S18 [Coprinopsis marcescibilis]